MRGNRFIDLTGQRFGRLVVVKELPREGSASPRWLCKCDCGGERISTTIVLRRGDCNSCGCLLDEHLDNLHEESRLDDLTNKRFGRLLVVEKADKKIRNGIAWRCKCDCGNYTNVTASELKRGHIESCGCLVSDKAKSWIDEGTNIAKLKNKNINKRNKSGVTGVSFDKARNKWAAEIMFQRKRYRLGRFDELKDAAKARKEAEDRLHGDFLEWYEGRDDNNG